MTLKIGLIIVATSVATMLGGCRQNKTTTPTGPSAANSPVSNKEAGPLPDEAFKAEISLVDPPAKLRAGQVEVINLKVKNASNAIWWQRGGESTIRSDNKFYMAAGNRWLDKDGKLTSETEGHNGIPKDLKPGEEADMTLQITAPKTPGEWTMSVDMLQEGVAWFGDKGSPTAKAKVTVVK